MHFFILRLILLVAVFYLLIDRASKLTEEKGLANWVEMFTGDRLDNLSSANKIAEVAQIELQLCSSLYKYRN